MRQYLLGDPLLAQLLIKGAVGVLPTDTVYGIVCSATQEHAVTRLYALKSRERKPGTIIAANNMQVHALGFSPQAIQCAASFWPGVSVILPLGDERMYLHQGLGDIAVRVVSSPDIARLLVQTGPLLTSSANFPGQIPAYTINAAQELFGERMDFYVEGGNLSDRIPSTLIRIKDGRIEVVRQGSVSLS